MYKKMGIPLDVMWSDIDYLHDYEDFTVDPIHYAGLKDFVKTLHTDDMHYIPIVDAGIASRPDGGYQTYTDGAKAGIFIKDYMNKEPFVGKVWPGDTVFVDWSHPQAAKFWQNGLANLAKEVDFDGLWLDMNEATSFCDGACLESQKNPDSVLYSAPYWPTGRNLNSQVIDVDAMHDNKRSELEYHNMYAYGEVKATYEYLTQTKKTRAAIISRSSFAGQGRYGSKWTGDNYSNPTSMGVSVTGIMQMNMFGIPLTGADVCGFHMDTTPELCARWTKLASFYPFARNHNDVYAESQEPYQKMFDMPYRPAGMNPKTGKVFTYQELIINAIKERYQYIPYLYSNMIDLHMTGGTYFKPLFHNFPLEQGAYQNIESNFMLGDHIKVGMVTNAVDVDSADFYFPSGTWCPLFDYSTTCVNNVDEHGQPLKEGQSGPFPATADVAQVHIRGGSIVPTANIHGSKAIMNVADLREQSLDLHISPMAEKAPHDYLWSAEYKKFYLDDGMSLSTSDPTQGDVNVYDFKASAEEESRFDIMFDLSEKATNKFSKGDDCYITSENDYLGDVYIHNAP